MLKKIKKFTILFFVILVSVYIGYEYPQLVKVPKSIIKNPKIYYEFVLFKIGLRDNLLTKKEKDKNKLEKNNIKVDGQDVQETEFKANSFSLKLTKVKTFSEKAISVFILDKYDGKGMKYEIFTQDGYRISNNQKLKIDLPLFTYEKQDGGVRRVILIENEYFALITKKKFECLYLSLINLKNGRDIIKSKCLPDPKGADFAGVGGAYAIIGDKILLTIGAPEHNAHEIAKLAQSKEFIFGKILHISKKSLLNQDSEKIDYNIFSLGHRNPQGLVYSNKNIFSLEHGPQGGDELNKILEGKNYGWPIASYGTRYNNGSSYALSHSEHGFEEPMFVFTPAVAPTAINKCPKNLSDYYKNKNCLIALSLRAQSILIFLLNKNNTRVLNVEKIFIEKRLRHFGLDKNSNLYIDKENNFYISADNDGLYKVKFNQFR